MTILVDLNKALKTESYARAIFMDYNYSTDAHKTYEISDSDMETLTAHWEKKGRVSQWRTQATKDNTEYQISDSNYNSAKEDGKNAAKNSIGYDGNAHTAAKAVDNGLQAAATIGGHIAGYAIKNGVTKTLAKAVVLKSATGIFNGTLRQFTTTLASHVGEAVGANFGTQAAKKAAMTGAKKAIKTAGLKGFSKVFAKSAAKNASKAAAKEFAKTGSTEAAKKAGEQAGQKTAQNAGKSIGIFISCALALAEGTKAMLKPDNKEEVESLRKARDNELPQAQNALYAAQSDMADNEAKILDIAGEHEEAIEDANDTIDKNKTQYDMFSKRFVQLKQKRQEGKQLTESEQSMYKELSQLVGKDGELLQDTQKAQEEALEETENSAGLIDEFQSNYDANAETIAEVNGVTDLVASYDKATQTMCYVSGGVQSLNVASGGWAAGKALAMAPTMLFGAPAAYAAAACGFAGAGMSAKVAANEFQWASETGQIADLREQTQVLSQDTTDFYINSVDTWVATGEGVKESVVMEPEDMDGEDPGQEAQSEPAEQSMASINNSQNKPKRARANGQQGGGSTTTSTSQGTQQGGGSMLAPAPQGTQQGSGSTLAPAPQETQQGGGSMLAPAGQNNQQMNPNLAPQANLAPTAQNAPQNAATLAQAGQNNQQNNAAASGPKKAPAKAGQAQNDNAASGPKKAKNNAANNATNNAKGTNAAEGHKGGAKQDNKISDRRKEELMHAEVSDNKGNDKIDKVSSKLKSLKRDDDVTSDRKNVQKLNRLSNELDSVENKSKTTDEGKTSQKLNKISRQITSLEKSGNSSKDDKVSQKFEKASKELDKAEKQIKESGDSKKARKITKLSRELSSLDKGDKVSDESKDLKKLNKITKEIHSLEKNKKSSGERKFEVNFKKVSKKLDTLEKNDNISNNSKTSNKLDKLSNKLDSLDKDGKTSGDGKGLKTLNSITKELNRLEKQAKKSEDKKELPKDNKVNEEPKVAPKEDKKPEEPKVTLKEDEKTEEPKVSLKPEQTEQDKVNEDPKKRKPEVHDKK